MTQMVRDEVRSFRGWFIALSLIFAAATIWAVVDETWVRRPWKGYQDAWATLRPDAEAGGVRQFVVPQLGVVDRCATCHAGFDEPGLIGDAVPPALRGHPNHALLIDKHPPHRFGCTPCHRGQGLALTEGTAHGEDDPHWAEPLARGAYAESGCLACHRDDNPLVGAPRLTRGRELFAALACDGCHVDGLTDQPKRGTSLRHVAARLSPAWMLAWIRDPAQRRRTARMPQFWPGALDDPAVAARRDTESMAMAAYLLEASVPPPLSATATTLPAAAALADAALRSRGEQIFNRVGCRGCHTLGSPGGDDLEIRDELGTQAAVDDAWGAFGGDPEPAAVDEAVAVTATQRPIDFGPPLSEVGKRLRPAFIQAWLRDPKAWWPDSRMPDMHLSDEEGIALTAWLTSLGGPFHSATPPPLQAPRDAALVERGRVLIGQYGCNGCHDIPGFDSDVAPGPELTAFGRKDPRELSFGEHLPPRAERTWARWTEAKLAGPRRFATADIELWMPDYGLAAADVEALAVYVRGLRGEEVAPDWVHRDPLGQARQAGDRLIEERGCTGCHGLDGRAGDVARYYRDDWLAAPSLDGLGEKLQPPWLFGYLVAPFSLRPWLEMRMPRFGLASAEAATLVRAFAARVGRAELLRPLDTLPPDGSRAGQGERFFAALKCVSCHMLSQLDGVKTADLAPDLGLARSRLQPAWVRRFLRNPGAILPGTRMPQFFPDGQTPDAVLLGGDAAAQMRLLVDYLMHLGLQPVRLPVVATATDAPAIDAPAIDAPDTDTEAP